MNFVSYKIQTDHFEVDQYVRVQLSSGRSEIGVVVQIDESKGQAVVATRHGYEITVYLSSVRRAFLLILDLNGVLVARGRGSFVDRPGVDGFINFVMNNFVVAVWTSGLERTSNPIIDKVFDGYQDRLLFRLYRDSCTVLPTPDKPYRTIKNLQHIFDAYPKSFHAVNTIIVDDSPDKCSHPDIALCPVPFNDPEKQMNDNGLALAMEVLKEILRTESSAPLIRASEERLLALAAQEELDREDEEERILDGRVAKSWGGCESGLGFSKSGVANSGGLPETLLWTMRLCCDHISGGCAREGCRFSHDADDGKRPCSRKDHCGRGHARRWTGDTHRGAGTAPTTLLGTSGEVRASVNGSDIFSLFAACSERQTQRRCAKEDHCDGIPQRSREWERIKQQLQQQEEMQRQLQERKEKQQQQSMFRQKGKRMDRRRGKNDDGHKNKRATSADRNDSSQKGWSDVVISAQTRSRESSQCNAPLVEFMVPKGVSVHLSADSQDGFAILRQLRASLSYSKSKEKRNK